MADRYQSDDRWRRMQRGSGRQAEQYESGYDADRRGQMGESWRDDDYETQQTGWQPDDRYERSGGRDGRGPSSGGYASERFGPRGYDSGRFTRGGERGFSSFTGSDFGGRDFAGEPTSYGRESEPLGERSYGQDRWRSGNYGAGSWLGANHGEWRDFDGGRRYARSRGDDRGFFERAGEAIGRWFGDDDGYGRRENYRGHGPAGYTRTDERIREDVSERLTDDWAVDARKIEVTVSGGEITLDGTVTSRDQKRRAEDIAENVSGVKHVQNNLRVDEGSTWDRNNSGEATVTTTR